MIWDTQHGRWMAQEPKEPTAGPPSPKRRATSPARPSVGPAPLPMNAGGAAASSSSSARRGIKGHVEEPMNAGDPELPGWLVLQRTTNTGRSYKVFHGPNGEYAESKRQAMLLASGQPLTAAQLAFKSKPAPRAPYRAAPEQAAAPYRAAPEDDEVVTVVCIRADDLLEVDGAQYGAPAAPVASAAQYGATAAVKSDDAAARPVPREIVKQEVPETAPAAATLPGAVLEAEAAEGRGDRAVFIPAGVNAEGLREFLKLASEAWSFLPSSSPRGKAKAKGGKLVQRFGSGGAYGLDAAAQEAALESLHVSGYQPEVALAQLRATAPPAPCCESWSYHERLLFDGGLNTSGKDFADMRHTITSRSCRELVQYFYERKCRATLAVGQPAFIEARHLVLSSQRRGVSGAPARGVETALRDEAAHGAHHGAVAPAGNGHGHGEGEGEGEGGKAPVGAEEVATE
ncbi:hypothetical protein Ctob_008048 [Chrysochromulina tobinii]|uniref:SANT domain-containing protein n=1 Tax=Chrysochromulina tobinii TaxID=1460289 RepID=A0A0M0K685_9EUKA|nr:hypothetical protein Ctob_008048 [Chrysochromulina tobinii]|eukprot:KOO33898.1 hypothetical protein Ctob_008048 [Chrysochromulina sp. CCMP291]